MASIIIGLLLAGVAVLPVRESRGLLIGEGIRPAAGQEICRMVRQHAGVLGVSTPLSMYIGRNEVLLALDVEFEDGTPAEKVAGTIVSIERVVRERFPVIRRYLYRGTQACRAEPARPATRGAVMGPSMSAASCN